MQRMTVSAGIRRSPIRTPAMRGADSSPSTSASPVTSPVWLRTPAARQVRTSASTMSPARSDTGKTRLPRSTFNATPHPSKKVRVSCVSKPDRALYRKRGFVSTCRRNSSRSQSLVTLHRPFPVMRSLRQGLPRGLQGLGGGDCRHHAGGTGADNQHARSVGHTLISPSAVDSGLLSYTS